MPPHLTSYQSLVTSKARRRSKPEERPKAPRSGPSELEEVHSIESLIPLEEYQLRLKFIDEIRKAPHLQVLKSFLGVMASSVQANINNSRNATGRLLQKAAYKIELPEEYQNNSSTKTQMIPALEVVVDLKPSNVKYEAVTKLRQGVGYTDPLWNVVYLSTQLHK
ncbi:hypothetical protein FOXYS1_8345 [Fusarium oxysporum]|uniref:Uncharacterized protein n=1 Tax=Fusarium oxysporum TaxID=5507 RepID=A0A8H5AAV0_FUSOX|nr:hypothetical protein FOXYS1_8345 [Fusarium oxysporum]